MEDFRLFETPLFGSKWVKAVIANLQPLLRS